jgi:hypothetical protein
MVDASQLGAGSTLTFQDNSFNSSFTILSGGGGDSLSVSGNDTIGYLSAGDSFSNAASSNDINTDQIGNFQDVSTVLDFSQLAGASTETFYGQKAGASFAAAFGADSPNAVDYAVIGGNTFVHAAGAGGGYSAGDLLVELQGSHTLTGGNFHLHA